jgi:hypothetical protein
VETVPGALDASILSFKVTIGAAYKKGKIASFTRATQLGWVVTVA